MKKSLNFIFVSVISSLTSLTISAADLATSYQQALKNDPLTLRAKAQFLANREAIEQSRAVLLPQLDASARYSVNSNENFDFESGRVIKSDVDSLRLSANLSMQLYHHNSWLRLDNAKKLAHRSDIAYQIAQQDLIVRVTRAYFDVLRAKDDVEFAGAEQKAIARQLEQTKQRFDVGLTAITDVHEAQAEFDNAVTQSIRAKNSLYNAEEGLRELTNSYPSDLSILNKERFSASRPSPDSANQWQQTAEAKNLALISQKVGVDIAKENINIAKSGHLPTLSLQANYTRDDNDFEVFEPPTTTSNSIGIQLSVPLYSGGATSSAVKQAQHNYVAASQDLEQTYRQTVRLTRNAYNDVIANVSAIKSLEQSVTSAESALKATEAGFEVGTRTIVDVLNSTRNLYNAKRNLSSTRYNYILAILGLKRAAGTISEKDINDINKGLTKS